MDLVNEQPVESTSSVEALNSLKQCSICLENYSKPKVLPCQHSYCYSCLVNIASGRSRITCPHCREEHQIPESGVSGFRDSLVINQLLSISLPSGEYCADCKVEAIVSQCEHCATYICTKCLVQHAKLCIEITTSLRHIKEEILSSDIKERFHTKKPELQKCRDAVHQDYEHQTEALEDQLQKLKRTLERLSSLAMFVKSTIRIYDDLIALSTDSLPDESYISSLVQRVDYCSTLKSLDKLKSEVSDYETVARLAARRGSDSFKFSLDIQNPDVLSVEYGKTVVNVKGTYQPNYLLERLNEIHPTEEKAFNEAREDEILEEASGLGAAVKKSEKAEEKEIHSDTNVKCSIVTGNTEADKSEADKCSQIHGEEFSDHSLRQEQPVEIGPRRQSGGHFKIYRSAAHVRDSSRTTSTPCPPTMAISADHSAYQQNQLPHRIHSITGRHEIEIIGQSERLSSKHKLVKPVTCGYHVNTDGICVVDKDNSRIMFCSTDGSQARTFITGLKNLRDVAITHDGYFVNLLFSRDVWLMEIATAEYIGHLYKCSLGNFKDIKSVLCLGNSKVVIIEGAHHCLIVFKNSREIRHFGHDYLKQPMSVAYNPTSKRFYVTDSEASCVKVFACEGRYIQTFAAQAQDNDISGIAVDADDYVYVARILSNRIDIYNSRRQLVRAINNDERPQCPLMSPSGLCLMPSGKLIVADTGNDRLQIL